MAVSEACKNVSCHGEQGLSDQYEISFKMDEGYLEIKVVECVWKAHASKGQKDLFTLS